MEYVLGIDGGGTTTAYLLADAAGRVIARAEAPGSNHRKTDLNEARAAISAGLREITRQIGIGFHQPLKLAALCAGLAGIDTEEDVLLMEEMFREIVSTKNLRVVNDGEIALAGALEDQAGVVVISGTGSIVWAAGRTGERLRVGGWDYILGDEGSSYSVGLRVLRKIAAAHDSRIRPTRLTEEVFARLGVADLNGLLRRVYDKSMTPQQIAALAPVADREAERGDAAAACVLDEAADELVELACSAARLAELDGAPYPLAAMGGALLAGGYFARLFRERMRQKSPHVRFVSPRRKPVEGAMLLALRAISSESNVVVVHT